ncbi:MAG: family 2 glycosyl transferase [Stygiobacter sp.]|nr:MAG: family 2 glycosyl transferase [Stygiobacter sp.]KAF0216959.1 MAG: family 2 glycosyl [Ignavibacteria bacterium]
MKLSIIIPAYNEEKKIEKDILLADKFISEQNLSGEIIVVDDGSSDATFQKANGVREKIATRLVVKKSEKNLGKGYAVKRGMLEASGEYIAYCDAGSTVSFSNLLIGLNLLMNNECDIVHGSRLMPGSVIRVSQEKDRKFSSSVIRFLVTKFLGVSVSLTDTQCGFKIYKSEAAKELFSKLRTNGFMFEVENILRAIKRNYCVKEFPVEWSCDRDSRITFLKTPWRVLFDIVRIKFMKID